MTTASSQKPRFTSGQRVMLDPAYAREYPRRARNGAVGEVTIVGRRVRGERRYEVYFPDERATATGLKPATIRIPEGYLQAVSPPVQEPTHDAPQFAVGQLVKIHANQGGLYGAQIGIIGTISQQRQKRRLGYYWYDVTYPSSGKPSERIVIVREDDLELAPEVPEVMEPEAPTPPATTAAVASEPRFTLGQKVMLDSRSDLAYDRVARKGAVGVIVGVGQPVRGIRRYDVQYAGTPEATRAARRSALGLLPIVGIREEHLLPVIAETSDGAGIGLRDIKPVYSGVATIRCGNATPPCAHEGHWQAWDNRYQRCTQCGAVERM